MELDELKSIWQTLDQKLQRENKISLAMLRHQKLDRARTTLRPLVVGQTFQLFWGVFFILVAAVLWSTKPHAVPVILAGVIVHAYGIGCIIVAALVLGAIHRIDYAGSVLEVQSKLARVRRAYVVSGLVGGLTWWFLWIPLLMVLAGLAHVNLYAHAPSVIWIGMAVGVAGVLGTRWLYEYSRNSSNPRVREEVDNAVFGRSLQKVQAQLEEIRRFEEENP
jgi:hypothetical protein